MLRTYKNEEDAEAFCRMWNTGLETPRVCIVDGPEDDDYTVMDIADAIDSGFEYRWEAPIKTEGMR